MSVRRRTWTTANGEAREAWVADFVDASGRHLRTFDRRQEAADFLATVRTNIKAGIHTSSRAIVAEAAATWLAGCEGRLEPATVLGYQNEVDLHIVPFLGSTRLADITVSTVRAFMDRLRAEGRSPAMISRVTRTLGSVMSDAMERGLVAQNVVRSLARRKEHGAKQRYRLQIGVDIPSPDEIRAIIAHLAGPWRPLLLTAIFTGLRSSELRGLPWTNVDLKDGVIHVRQRADKFNTIGSPKSSSGNRSIPMPPLLTNTLREWKLRCPQSENGLVFPTSTGAVRDHANILTRGLWPAQILAGVVDANGKAKYTGLHSLRHWYASWCANRRADGGLELPLKVVQARLGHASISMTADRYSHLFPNNDTGAELATAERALWEASAG
jgi:integrase